MLGRSQIFTVKEPVGKKQKNYLKQYLLDDFHSVGHLVIPQSQLCQKGHCLSLSAQWQALRPNGASPRWEGTRSQTSGGTWL